MTNNSQRMKLDTGFVATSLPAILLATLLAQSAKAADTWDGGGGDDNWSTTNNWDTDTLPGFPAALTFGGATRLTPTNDLDGLTVNGITFAAGAGAFKLGGNPFTLAGNVTIALGGGVTNDQVINCPITLGATPVLSAAPVPGHFAGNKGVLILNGAISGPFGLTSGVTGSTKNYVQLNGANTYTGNTLITGNDASFSIGNANAFGSGKLIVGATPGDSQAWIQSVGNLTVTNDVEIRTWRFITVGNTIAGKAAGNLTLGGNVLLNQSAGADIYCQKPLTLGGTVSGGGPNGLRMAAGTLILQGVNTFTNHLRTSSADGTTFNINSDAALGHTNNSLFATYSTTLQTAGGTSFTLAPSRTFNSSAGKTITFDVPAASALTVPGPITGNAIAKKNAGTLSLAGANTYSGGTLLSNGTLAINADTALGADGGALSITAAATLQATTNLSLSAGRTVNLTNAAAYTATFAVPTNTTLAMACLIQGNVATNSVVSKTGPGTLILSGGTGGTQLGALGTLEGKAAITNGAWAINTASTQSEDATPFWVAGGATFEQTGGSLSLPRWVYLGVRWSADPTKNLTSTILLSGGTLTQASGGGLLVGRKNSAVLTVAGDAFLSLPGTLSLGEFAGYTTVCNIDGGVVAVPRIYSRARLADGPNSLTSILNLNGGTLRATSSERLIGGSGTDLNQYLTAAYVKSGGAIIDSQAYAISINQVLNHDPDLGTEPDGGLIKRGTGSLTLSTNATYTGVTSVEAGTLKLGVADTLMAGSRVLVSSNAVFDVNGKSQSLAVLGGSGTVSNNSLLSVTQTIAPGGTNAVGTLTLAAPPAGLSGVFLADVAADGSCDRLHVQGDLNLSGLALAVADASAWSRDQQYAIASYTGALTGPFASAALPDRWHVRYDTSNRKVFLSYDFGLLIMVR
ncbi:MAG TPA: autotransporter-associated beta strand repeat-containing protein [Kiritimatiellia bacterium]|nr:autotransporter-associated beta strand repeat-containing protein [Kiritimatiellia bacterium]HPS09320.1 autotransporter-associated beta strand repeat-containing protein [Kiritimatiellia bacterium]